MSKDIVEKETFGDKILGKFLGAIKKKGKLTVRKTMKIFPGVRLSGTLNGVRLLLGGMGVTYSIPLIQKEKPKANDGLTAARIARGPRIKNEAVDPFKDRELEVGQRYVVQRRAAAQALGALLDGYLVITDIGGIPPMISYRVGQHIHCAPASQFVRFIEEEGLAQVQVNHEDIEAEFKEIKEDEGDVIEDGPEEREGDTGKGDSRETAGSDHRSSSKAERYEIPKLRPSDDVHERSSGDVPGDEESGSVSSGKEVRSFERFLVEKRGSSEEGN